MPGATLNETASAFRLDNTFPLVAQCVFRRDPFACHSEQGYISCRLGKLQRHMERAIQSGRVIWLTGLSAAGKTTLGRACTLTFALWDIELISSMAMKSGVI